MRNVLTREDMASLFNEMGFKTGAEIGVKAGVFSTILCERIPGLKLKCIDPWLGYRVTPSGRRMQRYFVHVTENLGKKYGAEIIRKTSMEAVEDVPDGTLDFVYIDALHSFDYAMMDIIKWTPKVRLGGVVSGHDYIAHRKAEHVKIAVDAYVQAHGIQLFTTTMDWPSFFWVR